MHIAVVQRAAVVAAHDEEAHRLGIELLEHIADGEEIAQRLGHFLVVDVDEAVVHPGARKGLAGRAFALGDFVLMVRKLQVGAAAMDVEAFTQQLAAHGRALDVPARAPLAPGTVPFDFFGLGRLGALPEHEVQRIGLAVIDGHAFAGLQLVERLARQLAVARKLAHREVHVAGAGLVGQAALLQPVYHAQHLRHIVGGARLEVRALYAQRIRILVQRIDHAVGQLAYGFAVFHRAADDLVFDVGDVAHVGHAQPAGAQPALHDVERHHRARMAQMAEVVDGHAAYIHADVTRLYRRKRFQCTRQRVVDTQTHGMSNTRERGEWPADGDRPCAPGAAHPAKGAPGSIRADTPQLQWVEV